MDRSVLRLIAVTDEPGDDDHAFVDRVLAAERGGATCIQLRSKSADARRLAVLARELVARLSVPLIVNDRADVAIAAGAAGVHLGPEDVPADAVRAFAPQGFVIGVSVGNDDELVAARFADYVGVGPVFATGSKPDAGSAIGLEEMVRLIFEADRPGVAIGGISPANARAAVEAGASGVAALSAIFAAADPEAASRALRSAIGT